MGEGEETHSKPATELEKKGYEHGELVAHSVCLAFAVIGFLMVAFTVEDADDESVNRENVLFKFGLGATFSLFMLINCGRQYPGLIPVTIAMGFYWFPEGINTTDAFRELNDNAVARLALGYDKQDTRLLVCGGVFILFGTFLNVVVEAAFPKPGTASKAGPAGVLAVMAVLLSIAGCLAIFAKNGRGLADFNDFQTTSIQGLIAAIFGLDTAFFYDPVLSVAAMFMCTVTFAESFDFGVTVNEEDNDDLQTVRGGFLALALGLFALLIINIFRSRHGPSGVERGRLGGR